MVRAAVFAACLALSTAAIAGPSRVDQITEEIGVLASAMTPDEVSAVREMALLACPPLTRGRSSYSVQALGLAAGFTPDQRVMLMQVCTVYLMRNGRW